MKRQLGKLDAVLHQDASSFWSRRGNLHAMEWKLGYLPFPPMLSVDEDSGDVSGFLHELWKTLRKEVNVTISLVRAKSFGKVNELGHWEGLVGMLENKTLDVTLNTMKFSYERCSIDMKATYSKSVHTQKTSS